MNLIQYWKEENKQDFDAFVKTNTSVSQIQALTELKKDAVELTTDEFGQVEVVEIDAIDNLIRTIEEGNPIVENNKTITDQLDKSEVASVLYGNNYRKLPEDSVVLSREEYEMLKSLYDTQKGAIMTSSIGDLPLTVEGLRKAVDEITRLNRVETELQELNAKYYNEAKDLRRELKQTRKETAEKIISAMKTMIINRRADERSGLNSIYTTYSPERLFDDILDYVRIAMGVEVEQ